jgi:FkbM family methyltransferase
LEDIKDFVKERIVYLEPLNCRIVPDNVKAVIMDDGVIFELSSANFTIINQVNKEYCYDDIRKTDIVLDIGANIGAFSLKIHDKVSQVYAVEPLYNSELRRNTALNKADNIHVLPFALSRKDRVDIEFGDKFAHATGMTLYELRYMCGWHVDFLKCDCEGGEWCIEKAELEGIRRIEAEIHGINRLDEFLKLLDNYDVKIEYSEGDTALIHASEKKSKAI